MEMVLPEFGVSLSPTDLGGRRSRACLPGVAVLGTVCVACLELHRDEKAGVNGS